MTEKILARAAGRNAVQPGEVVVVKVDTTVVIDIGFYPGFWRWPTKVYNPDKSVVIHDHREGILLPADKALAKFLAYVRRYPKAHPLAEFA